MNFLHRLLDFLYQTKKRKEIKHTLNIEIKRETFGNIKRIIPLFYPYRPFVIYTFMCLLVIYAFRPGIFSAYMNITNSIRLDIERRKFLQELDEQEKLWERLNEAKKSL